MNIAIVGATGNVGRKVLEVLELKKFPINQLCQINKLSKEFERTASRLYEMTIITQKK